MKKTLFVLILIVILFIAGCTQNTQQPTTQAQTTISTIQSTGILTTSVLPNTISNALSTTIITDLSNYCKSDSPSFYCSNPMVSPTNLQFRIQSNSQKLTVSNYDINCKEVRTFKEFENAYIVEFLDCVNGDKNDIFEKDITMTLSDDSSTQNIKAHIKSTVKLFCDLSPGLRCIDLKISDSQDRIIIHLENNRDQKIRITDLILDSGDCTGFQPALPLELDIYQERDVTITSCNSLGTAGSLFKANITVKFDELLYPHFTYTHNSRIEGRVEP